ncbi:DAZAP2 [Cervus elaphus hippelaphus]|uniref:DAZ-associated protein 2 n=1 Tax=Cervus elaphus hippelaphus TaxID=46360 RepID=A0A212DFG0_CEREH|nr:DAZAP2 [Cervus elaphus hippelaphus]
MVDNMVFLPPCLPGQYPTQPTYPVQPPGNPVYPQTLHLPQAPPYTDAPPAYSEVLPLYRPSFVHPGAATVPTMSAAFPGASLYLPMAQSVAVGPLGSTIPMAYYPVGPIYPPGSTVLVEGGYDAGARFGAGATAGNIPVTCEKSEDDWAYTPASVAQYGSISLMSQKLCDRPGQRREQLASCPQSMVTVMLAFRPASWKQLRSTHINGCSSPVSGKTFT